MLHCFIIILRKSLSKEYNLINNTPPNNPLFDVRSNSMGNNLINIGISNIANECPICILEIEKNKSFNLNCNHKFCLDCIQEYLDEEIKNSRVIEITCPMKNCKVLFDENTAASCLGNSTGQFPQGLRH